MQRYSIIKIFIVSRLFVQIMSKFLVIRITKLFAVLKNNREHFQITQTQLWIIMCKHSNISSRKHGFQSYKGHPYDYTDRN